MQLVLIRQRYTPYGGAERFVERALDALAARGVTIRLLTRKWPPGTDARVQPVIVNPGYLGRTMRDRGFARAVCAKLEAMPEALVQSHERIACCDIYRAGDGVHAVWVAERVRDAPGWQRSAIAASPYHRYMLAAERELYSSPRLQRVICISRMVQTEIHERFGLPRERLPVIYNAIDPAMFNPGLRMHRDALRASHAIAGDAVVFLLVGSAYARKGVGRAIEALAEVPAPAHLLVVGRDRDVPRYRRLARHCGVGARVTFAGAQRDPRPFYGAADAFVLPTLYDALSNAVLEALACGLPVITSDRCGAAELVAAHAAGTVCAARDIGAIATGMQRMLSPEARARAGAGALEAMRPLTPTAMSLRLIELYESLLGARA
jgi:UDP-glucose:(heptosyl)LPS alpha-1,3-glucosyltransferase